MPSLARVSQGYRETKEQAAIVSELYGGSRFRWSMDMLWCLVRYGARPIDYARFEFYKKSARERDKYLTIFRYFTLYKQLIGGVSVAVR